MNTVLDKILINLEIITKIPRGRKISTEGISIRIYDDGQLEPLYRSLRGNSSSRYTAIDLISWHIDLAIELSERIQESKYLTAKEPLVEYQSRLEWLKQINIQLKEVLSGIVNVSNTYNGDPEITVKTDRLFKDIDSQIKKLEKLLDEHSHNNIY